MKLVLNRGGTPLDHVALGVPDTERGVAEISRLTGFTPTLTEPEPNQFYWSGALPLGSGRFLEILGPNPAFRGFNPFIEIVKRLDKPRPLFWYVATNDFGAFAYHLLKCKVTATLRMLNLVNLGCAVAHPCKKHLIIWAFRRVEILTFYKIIG